MYQEDPPEWPQATVFSWWERLRAKIRVWWRRYLEKDKDDA
jgi:hypothetical protein